jgi:hypothetical protein
MARVISVLTELRTLSHHTAKKCETTSFSLVPDSCFPPLLKEILLSPKQSPNYSSQLNYFNELKNRQEGCCDEQLCSSDPMSSAPTFFSHMVEPLRHKLTTINLPTPSPSEGYQSDEGASCSGARAEEAAETNTASSDTESSSHNATLIDISNNVPKLIPREFHEPQLD